MCGIAGANLSTKERGVDSLALARELLRAIESRGRHASGAAWHEGGEDIWYDKAALPGSQFGRRLSMSPNATNFILHARFATQGTPQDNRNNHPHIAVTDDDCILGVHNGVLWNDEAIFRSLADKGVKPQSDCDSEAVFALLANSGMKVRDTLPLIRGDAALAWIRRSRPGRLHLAVTEGRPLVIGRTRAGSTVFASTEVLLRSACWRASVPLVDVWAVPDWVHVIVENGTAILTDYLEVPVVARKEKVVTPVASGSVKTKDLVSRWERPKDWKPMPPQNRRQPITSRSAPERYRQTPLWDMPADPADLPDRYGLTPAAIAALRLGQDA